MRPRASRTIENAVRRLGYAHVAGCDEFVQKWVRWGAGPRAGQSLLLGAKAKALLEGRLVAAPEDVAAVALPVLRHRVLVNFQGEADGIDTDAIIGRLLAHVKP